MKTLKIVSVFIFLVVCITASAGTKSVVEFWHYWDGNNGKAINELAANFNKNNPDIEVKPVFIPGNELLIKIQTAIASKKEPAIAAADISQMARIRATGKLLQLDPYLAKYNIEKESFYPELLEYGTEKGKTVALPVSTNNLALFYNKDIFKKAGLDPNNPPKTWEELEKYSKTVTEKLPGIYGFEFYTMVGDSGEGLTWQLQPYLWQCGAEFMKNGKPGFNNVGGIKAVSFLSKMINAKYSPIGSWDNFAKGKSAMVVDGSWMVGIWKDSVNFEFGTAMIPIPTDGKNATNMGGEQIFAFKKSAKENDAAVRFIAYMTYAKTQVEWDKMTYFMPVRDEVAESKIYLDWVKKTEPRLMPFVEQQKYAKARPSIIQYPGISLEFAKEIEKAYYGRVAPAEAIKNAERAILEIIK